MKCSAGFGVVVLALASACADGDPPAPRRATSEPPGPTAPAAGPAARPRARPVLRVETDRSGAVLVIGRARVALDDRGAFDRERLRDALAGLGDGEDSLEVELQVPPGVPVTPLVLFLEDEGKVAIVRDTGAP